MDDPWGSPWADDTQLQTHQQPASTTNHEVRPVTPVKATALALQEKTNSPWNDEDDDGFGGWAAVPSEEPQFGLDGVGGGWESTPTNGDDFAHSDLNSVSIPWGYDGPTEKKAYPSLGPSPLPKSTDLAQQPPPPPLETESQEAWNRMHTELDDVKINALDRKETAEGNSTEKHTSLGSPKVWSAAEGSSEPSKSVGSGITTKLASGESPTMGDISSIPQDILQAPDIEPILSSRPSSSPSEHSHHDDVLHESPRTSLDEEPNRPHASRKVSTKIKGLVEHFDSLAKPDADVPIIGRTISVEGQKVTEQKPQEEENDDDFGDFGDFEDGQSDVDDSVTETPTSQARHAVSGDHRTAPEKSQEVLISPTQSRIASGPVKSDFDTAELVKLFPTSEETEEETAVEKVYIPDVVPFDSFSSTEERKMWYRLSRYGPMRKHNSGNDENYTRANWSQSEVRTDTLKIVARWLEEDRISGRVVLGGGSKGSSIFGWNDAKAPPIPLSDAFASRNGKEKGHKQAQSAIEVPREWPKGLVKERSAAKSQSPSKARRRSSVKSSSISEVSNVAEPPVASFSWNTPSDTVQLGDLPPATKPLSPVRKVDAPVVQTTSPRRSLSQPSNHVRMQSVSTNPGPSLNSTKTRPSGSHTSNPSSNLANLDVIPIKQEVIMSGDEDDEDDWGELISSPVTTLPPFLATNNFNIKKPQPEPVTSASILQAPTTSIAATSNHQSFGSLEAILSPAISSEAFNEPWASSLQPTSNGFEPIPTPQQGSMPSIPPTQTIAVVNDPWASADFSFFDTPSAAAPIPTASKTTKATPTKSVKFSTPSPLEPRKLYKTREEVEIDDIVHKITPPKQHKSREEIEQDGIVRSIVEKLPNLSYMLKR